MEVYKTDDHYTIQSLQRALTLLRCFHSEQSSMSLLELCKATSFGKSTTFRIIVNLQRQGFLATNEIGRYIPGPEIVRLATFADNDLQFRKLAYPYISFLSDVTRETTLLTKLKRDCLFCIDKIESRHALRIASQVGEQVTMMRGATGTSVAAFLDGFHLMRVIEDEKRRSMSQFFTPVDSKKLAAIRVQGYALTQSEVDTGVCAIASPVFGEDKEIIGSISIVGPSIRFDTTQASSYERLLRRSCQRITQKQEFSESFRQDSLSLLVRR